MPARVELTAARSERGEHELDEPRGRRRRRLVPPRRGVGVIEDQDPAGAHSRRYAASCTAARPSGASWNRACIRSNDRSGRPLSKRSSRINSALLKPSPSASAARGPQHCLVDVGTDAESGRADP